jgi:hypothetical protein
MPPIPGHREVSESHYNLRRSFYPGRKLLHNILRIELRGATDAARSDILYGPLALMRLQGGRDELFPIFPPSLHSVRGGIGFFMCARQFR